MKNRFKINLLLVAAIMAALLITIDLFGQQDDLLKKVRENDIEAVKALLAAGSDVNQEDDMMGYTALGMAKSTEMMNVLISAGAYVNHRDKRTGYTTLMNLLNSSNTELAKFLIGKGADIKIQSNDGTTALILACGCSGEIAKQLLDKGADIHAITDRGMGVFTQCTNVGLSRGTVSYDFAEFLLSMGADINEKNTTDYYGGYTPLFWAVESGDEKLVSFLVNHGANVNIKSNKGKTPLSIATDAGYVKLAQIIKNAGGN